MSYLIYYIHSSSHPLVLDAASLLVNLLLQVGSVLPLDSGSNYYWELMLELLSKVSPGWRKHVLFLVLHGDKTQTAESDASLRSLLHGTGLSALRTPAISSSESTSGGTISAETLSSKTLDLHFQAIFCSQFHCIYLVGHMHAFFITVPQAVMTSFS